MTLISSCLQVRYWLLGAKYETHDFQNSIMMQLLSIAYNNRVRISPDYSEAVFRDTESSSPLRSFLVEELIRQHAIGRVDYSLHLDNIAKVPGLLEAALKVSHQALFSDKDEAKDWFKKGENENSRW